MKKKLKEAKRGKYSSMVSATYSWQTAISQTQDLQKEGKTIFQEIEKAKLDSRVARAAIAVGSLLGFVLLGKHRRLGLEIVGGGVVCYGVYSAFHQPAVQLTPQMRGLAMDARIAEPFRLFLASWGGDSSNLTVPQELQEIFDRACEQTTPKKS